MSRWLCGGFAVWLITVLAQCAMISQREASQAFTCDKKQQQQLALRSGKLFVVPHWGGLCRGRSLNNNIVKNPFNQCLQSMHPLLS